MKVIQYPIFESEVLFDGKNAVLCDHSQEIQYPVSTYRVVPENPGPLQRNPAFLLSTLRITFLEYIFPFRILMKS